MEKSKEKTRCLIIGSMAYCVRELETILANDYSDYVVVGHAESVCELAASLDRDKVASLVIGDPDLTDGSALEALALRPSVPAILTTGKDCETTYYGSPYVIDIIPMPVISSDLGKSLRRYEKSMIQNKTKNKTQS